MLFNKTLNHLKLFRPYYIVKNNLTNSIVNNTRKRSFITANNIDGEYNYKKQKLNNRHMVSSSYIEDNVLENNIQWKYDITAVRRLLNEKLEYKSDGSKRDGLLFEKVLGIVYENEGYKIKHTGGINDCGVDLIAIKDTKKIAIQAKNYNNNSTTKYLNKNNIEIIFNKIKNIGEHKHLENGETFHSARLHIYNDNIVSYRPLFIEQLAIKHKYDMFDKCIYGKTWLLNYTNCLSKDSIRKFYNLFDR